MEAQVPPQDIDPSCLRYTDIIYILLNQGLRAFFFLSLVYSKKQNYVIFLKYNLLFISLILPEKEIDYPKQRFASIQMEFRLHLKNKVIN